MTQYIIQIDMSEFGEPAIWEDCSQPEFVTMTQAQAYLAAMQREYGDTIGFRIITCGSVEEPQYEDNRNDWDDSFSLGEPFSLSEFQRHFGDRSV